MRRFGGSLVFIAIMLMVDLYVFQAVKAVSQQLAPKTRLILYIVYWLITLLTVGFFAALPYLHSEQWQKPVRTYIFAILIGLFLAKLISIPFFMVDDIRRVFQWIVAQFITRTDDPSEQGERISRSAFMSWLGLGIGTTLFATLLWGFRNQYNYHVRKVKLHYANLPESFRGMHIVQISDIHSGGFMDKSAVERGVDMINAQKPDLVLFTGDLVNYRAIEMEPFMDVFSKVKSPMGVYSTLGNHDYGDYVSWPDRDESHAEKERLAGRHLLTPMQEKNLEKLQQVHAELGWRLMMDEWLPLEKNGQRIALIGVQNISGKPRFHTYGDLKKAYIGSEHLPFKILMSHDPSHWDSEVTPHFPDIDLTLSGHTHGMQFGVEIPGLKWSPVKWFYNKWAGLYEEGNQKLYINRGFGFLGYPGRVGILPEITVIELT
jgi:predicted MPP superfamily phosphohydrolase